MYTTCIFCNGPLGRNEAIEHFPVGRRLAFDAAKGRLWVVCPRCERWNLSPLETRWEAIEEAERAYRGMKLRVSTDNIGLARLHEGLELVRVGAPLLPEFAAWRYGDQFGKRRRKHLAIVGAGVAVGAVIPFVPWLVGVGSVALTMNAVNMSWIIGFRMHMRRHEKRICAVIRDDAGNAVPLTAQNINCAAVIRTDDAWHLAVPHGPMLSVDDRFRAMNRRGTTTAFEGLAELTGAPAIRALGTMLPHVNVRGATPRHVRDAVDLVGSSADVEHIVRDAAAATKTRMKEFGIKEGESYMHALPRRMALALEIMLHEHDERRAMEGELLELERRWQDAEAIASIADALTIPPEIEERLAALKR